MTEREKKLQAKLTASMNEKPSPAASVAVDMTVESMREAWLAFIARFGAGVDEYYIWQYNVKDQPVRVEVFPSEPDFTDYDNIAVNLPLEGSPFGLGSVCLTKYRKRQKDCKIAIVYLSLAAHYGGTVICEYESLGNKIGLENLAVFGQWMTERFGISSDDNRWRLWMRDAMIRVSNGLGIKKDDGYLTLAYRSRVGDGRPA